MAGKGDKEHKVVKEIKADVPALEDEGLQNIGSDRGTPIRSRNASRSASNPRPIKDATITLEARDVPAKIEEHEDSGDAHLGKRESSLRPAKHEEITGQEESFL